MLKDVKYDFFQNNTEHDLVQQYFSIREKAFIDQWGLKEFSGSEDRYDQNSIIIIAHTNGACIGGGRIILHEHTPGFLLPAETNEFQIHKALPELDLKNKIYGEVSRIALKDTYRDGKRSSEMYRMLLNVKARELGVSYLFCVTTMQLARANRIALKKLNIPFEIQNHIKVPDLPTYEGHKMVLSLANLTRTDSTEYQECEKVEDLICE